MNYLIEIFKPFNLKYKEFKNNKLDKSLYEEEKQNIELKINQLEKVRDKLDDMVYEQDRIKSYLNLNEKKLKSNPNFKIPYRAEEFENIPCPGRKNTICTLCLYNCHLDCKDRFKNFCKAFDFKFDCKVCPNKCGASSHNFANYEYPKCNYKPFNEMFPLSMIFEAERELEEQAEEYRDKIKSIDKNIEHSKKEVECYENYMKKKNEELNDEIENFRKNYEKNFKIHEKFDIEIFGLYIF